ncbi:MAG: Maf family protein [Chloroflexota bacterium]|nr:Maf family protein [Chloroflexota bacterium]
MAWTGWTTKIGTTTKTGTKSTTTMTTPMATGAPETAFVLASGSPRRRELLASLGIAFTVIKPDIDETQRAGEAPLDYVRRLSIEKAQTVATNLTPLKSRSEVSRTPLRLRRPSAERKEGDGGEVDEVVVLAADTVVILAADTIGVLQGDILGKPVDADDARAMLRRLRGRDHVVCTALTMVYPGAGRIHPAPTTAMSLKAEHVLPILTELTLTTVTMRDYSDAEIDAYIATGDPFDKAGSYAIQHEGFRPVTRIDGSYSNVVGLPLETLREMLTKIGYFIPSP